jgi:hypothetical protein
MDIDFSEITVSWLDKPQIWSYAETTRAKCWTGTLPVNVEVIAEKVFQIIIIPIPQLKTFVHTEAHLSGSLDEIDYDPTSPSVRIRFSIAHELGHRVLHPQQIKALRPSSYAEWKNTINYLPNAMWGRAEWQAREFAGRLLVPRELLIQEARKYQNEIEKAGKQIPDVTTDDITEFLAPRICNKFDVSDTVIKTRLCHEEIDLLNF